MIQGRVLARQEIKTIWQIDRSEKVQSVFCISNSELVLRTEYHDIVDWPRGQPEHDTPLLESCFDRGGWFYGLFDKDKIIGVVVLDSHRMGSGSDQLQLRFLHVSRDFRDRGLGQRLFNEAVREARRRNARLLYISATPSEHTIRFYLGLGCTLAAVPDAALFAKEPDDIHLHYDLGTTP